MFEYFIGALVVTGLVGGVVGIVYLMLLAKEFEH